MGCICDTVAGVALLGISGVGSLSAQQAVMQLCPKICSCSPHLPFVEKMPKCSALPSACQGYKIHSRECLGDL